MVPSIGETMSAARAVGLCQVYGLAYLVQRISNGQDMFKDWKFDGTSMVPDALFSQVFGIPNLIEIALRHDLKYAYGETGNKSERLLADQQFRQELLRDGAPKLVAHAMYWAVHLFGDGPIKTDFSWGFARK